MISINHKWHNYTNTYSTQTHKQNTTVPRTCNVSRPTIGSCGTNFISKAVTPWCNKHLITTRINNPHNWIHEYSTLTWRWNPTTTVHELRTRQQQNIFHSNSTNPHQHNLIHSYTNNSPSIACKRNSPTTYMHIDIYNHQQHICT